MNRRKKLPQGHLPFHYVSSIAILHILYRVRKNKENPNGGKTNGR